VRDFSELAYWKANEFKVFMFYTGISTLMHVLPQNYYQHFCLYVLIIRKLCDRDLKATEIENIDKLLLIWHQGVEKLYGDFELTFTAHAHLHLAKQVITSIYFDSRLFQFISF
jgi:hypothetical protein